MRGGHLRAGHVVDVVLGRHHVVVVDHVGSHCWPHGVPGLGLMVMLGLVEAAA